MCTLILLKVLIQGFRSVIIHPAGRITTATLRSFIPAWCVIPTLTQFLVDGWSSGHDVRTTLLHRPQGCLCTFSFSSISAIGTLKNRIRGEKWEGGGVLLKIIHHGKWLLTSANYPCGGEERKTGPSFGTELHLVLVPVVDGVPISSVDICIRAVLLPLHASVTATSCQC